MGVGGVLIRPRFLKTNTMPTKKKALRKSKTGTSGKRVEATGVVDRQKGRLYYVKGSSVFSVPAKKGGTKGAKRSKTCKK